MLITELRMWPDYLEKKKTIPCDTNNDDEMKATICKRAFDRVETNLKVELSEEFVLSMNASERKYTEPYSSEEISLNVCTDFLS